MPHPASLTVVATQLALTDRRALSEAWYSALRLAAPARAGSAALRGPFPAARRALGRFIGTQTQASVVAVRSGAVTIARTRLPQSVRPADVLERRAPPSDLARRIERALARRARHALPVSFAVRAAEGRVHLLVRADGTATRIVAVCAAPLRARVERALAQARFALAARGVRCEAGP
jgi:hypothetical protein